MVDFQYSHIGNRKRNVQLLLILSGLQHSAWPCTVVVIVILIHHELGLVALFSILCNAPAHP